MPGLPLFFRTRFSATSTLLRSTTRSIRSASSVPERSFPCVAVGASPLRDILGASPLPSSGSSSCLDFWRDALLRRMVVSLFFLFGPSRCQRLPGLRGTPCPASASLIWLLLTSRSDTRRCPFRHKARSPQVRVVAFAAQSLNLRRPPLVARTSRIRARSSWLAAPYIQFLFVDSQLLLLASFSADLAVGIISPCDLLGVPTTRFPGGLSPPGHAHAGHTRVGAPISEGPSQGTVLVLFTYGSSGRRVANPIVGRFATSPIPVPT